MSSERLIWNVKKEGIIKRIKEGQRKDGRDMMERRELKVTPGLIETAEGSSMVELGDTKVIAGIKLNIGTPFPDQPEKGALFTGVELYPVASPSYETGPPREQTIEISRVVDRGIRESNMINLEELCIEPGEKVWTVAIDIFPLDQDGNIIDASAIAAVSALINAKIPKYEDGDIIRGEYQKELPVTDTPIASTFSKLGNEIIMDPALEEEKAQDGRITIYTNDKGNVCASQKGGNSSFKRDEIKNIIKEAVKQSKKPRKELLKNK